MFGLFKTPKRKSSTAVRMVKAATKGAKVGVKVASPKSREGKR